MTDTTTVQRKEYQEFYRSYNRGSTEGALQDCLDAGSRALSAPELAEARINGTAQWNEWYTTTSIRATGRTKQGNAVVAYVHIPNWLANPANIRAAKEQGLVNYAARIPQEEFQQLVDAEDKKSIWVVDHGILRKSTSGIISLVKALKHPQVIPFLGDQERAERYLEAHAKAYDTKTIDIWHSDDLNDESALGRLLCLGYSDDVGLDGGSLSSSGRFLGVRGVNAEGAQKIVVASGLEKGIVTRTRKDIESILADLIPKFAEDELKARLDRLYKQ